MSQLVAEEYLSSLTDLTVNSKPLINMLTILADENVDHAPAIVQVIENHIEKVPPDVKLPILYLIDSIIKNVSKVYVPLFTQNIVNVFVSVFEKVDERTRLNMYKLRQTWADVFPARKLYVLDLRVKDIDRAWPVTAPTPTSIHFNPKFLGNKTNVAENSSATAVPNAPVINPVSTQSSELSEAILREQLPEKQKILIELQQKKLELQLMQTKALMEGQENRLSEVGEQSLTSNATRPPTTEEAAKLLSRKAGKSKTSAATISTKAASSKSGSASLRSGNEKTVRFSKRSSAKMKNTSQSSPSKKQEAVAGVVSPPKTKIAPASSQIIEAVKSRDPRIARRLQQAQNKNTTPKTEHSKKKSTTSSNSKSSNKSRESKSAKNKSPNKVPEVTQKEQEIYNRQLVMLKPPIAEQVAPVVPAQKDLENLVNVSGKDVDLRLLNVRSDSPSKKRLSPEVQIEEPPKKKNKPEVLDEISSLSNVKPEKQFIPPNVLSYVNTIIAQAGDQVRNGSMTLQEYQEVLKQVISVNEKEKLREAQNKSRLEVQRNQSHLKNRLSPNRFGPQNRKSPTFTQEEERIERLPYNDIDERLQMPWPNRSIPGDNVQPGFNRLNEPCEPPKPSFDILEGKERLKTNSWKENSNRRTKNDELEKKINRDATCSERTHDCVDVPPADPKVLEVIAKDPMKSINIDGTPRDIRFYGDTAVVMLSYDDPKEISFERGIRRVIIGDTSIVCALNDPYIMFMLNGSPHRIRLGAPTRELYIDDTFHEAHFGGPPVQILIDGLSYLVQLEGPPPQVKIGKRRTDLVCGRVNMIVDATEMLPLFLDAKPQRFDLKSKPYVFRFSNGLKTLLVNEVPLDIQFNGGCRQICGYGNLHFLRLSMLPSGIEPGRVQIMNMEGSNPPVSNIPDTTKVPVSNLSPSINNIPTGPPPPIDVSLLYDATQPPPPVPMVGAPLDILTSLMNGGTTPVQPSSFNYQIETTDPPPFTHPPVMRVDTVEKTTPQVPNSSVPILGSGLNINDLFQRLVATGIVPTLGNSTLCNTTSHKQKTHNDSIIKPIDMKDPNSLREKQPPIINLLYSGIQCSSCGVRFSPEETVKYSRHLDWHFRQNRREKDAVRKGHSRKWYYDLSDWKQFEEIEDLEERAQSWFETEGTSNGEEIIEQEEVKSVPAPPGHDFTVCEQCRDEFDTYYNEEKEEWHLKPCILVKEKYYHPVCYEDFLKAPIEPVLANKTGDSTIFKEETEEPSIILEEIKEEEEAMDVSETKEESGIVLPSESKDGADIESIDSENVNTKNLAKEDCEEVISTLLNELINCVVFKNEVEVHESDKEDDEDAEIQVIESVPVQPKEEEIIDLIEKLDDEDDDIVYTRKTPSPIVLIPTSKIKQEPVDEMESPVAVVDQTITSVVSSIDGNVEKIDAPQIVPSAPSKIKITFNKPITNETASDKPVVKEVPPTTTDDTEEPEPLPLSKKKPRIAEREMTVYLPCVKGTEMSGLCSIM